MAEVRGERAPTVEELRAVRFTLVDEAGNVRAALGPGSDGAAGLIIYDYDAGERHRAELSLDANGAANLKLHDRDGEVCAWLAVGRHGEPNLYLQGTSRHRDGVRGHAKLSVDQHGSPVLSLHDRDGQPRVLLGLDEETGVPSLSYSDARGESCMLLTEVGGTGRLHLFDRDGRPRGVPALPLGEAASAAEPADPEFATVFDRLARLERARSRRRISTAALVVLAALLGAGAGWVAIPMPKPPEPVAAPAPPAVAPQIGRVVETGELLLTDKTGALRARLSLLPDGTPLLWMVSADGTSSAELSVQRDAGAVLKLHNGASSITLVTPPGELPSVGAYDGKDVLFQAPSNVARFLPPDLWP